MKKLLIPLSIIIVASMAYIDINDRFKELDNLADQTEVQKNIKSQPQSTDGSGVQQHINKSINENLPSNIQNSGQNFDQGPTGFENKKFTPNANPANPLASPEKLPSAPQLPLVDN